MISHSILNDFFYIFSHNLTIIVTYFIDILNLEKEVINRKKEIKKNNIIKYR